MIYDVIVIMIIVVMQQAFFRIKKRPSSVYGSAGEIKDCGKVDFIK